MNRELKSIDFYEPELKQIVTIVEELVESIDHLGSYFDTVKEAKEANWEYFTTLGADQRILHLRSVLFSAIDRTLGEDAYIEECEAVIPWPKISPPEGTELEDPWWGADTGPLIGNDVGRYDWPKTTDPSIPQDILEQLKTVPAYLHGAYSVLDSPYWITDQYEFPQGLIAFAKSDGRICVDPTTGAVVKTSQYIIDHTTPVNSSLTAFVQCAHTFAKHYPFYPENSHSTIRHNISSKVYKNLTKIDPVIYDYPASAFWSKLTDRLSFGDFATERIGPGYRSIFTEYK